MHDLSYAEAGTYLNAGPEALNVHTMYQEFSAVRRQGCEASSVHDNIREFLPAIGHYHVFKAIRAVTARPFAAGQVEHEPILTHRLHKLMQPRVIDLAIAEYIRRDDDVAGTRVNV